MVDSNNIEKADNGRLFINVIKGIAIFLMLWGHVIQYCSQKSFDFFDNAVFKTVYSFHMPLFMLVSGYLFFYSFSKRDLKELILHRSRPLLWTIIMCGAFNYLITSAILGLYYDRTITYLNGALLKNYDSLWFLWSVLCSAIGVAIICKKAKSVWLQLLLLLCWTVVVYAFPNGINNVYMYPYFIIGFYFARYKSGLNIRKSKTLEWSVKIASICIFIVMLFFYEKKHYIYTTGLYGKDYGLLESLSIDVFRWAIGLFGSIAIISVVQIIFDIIMKRGDKKHYLTQAVSKMGENSLRIYALSVSLLSFWLPTVYSFAIRNIFGYNVLAHNMYLYDFVYTPLIAIAYSLGIYFVIKLFRKIKFDKILFGY